MASPAGRRWESVRKLQEAHASIGEETITKCKRTQAVYRARPRARLARDFSGEDHMARAGAMSDIFRESQSISFPKKVVFRV